MTGGEAESTHDMTNSIDIELVNSNKTSTCLAGAFLPSPRAYHTQSGDILCGGYEDHVPSTTCMSYTGGAWVPSHTLLEERYDHCSWRSPEGVLLMGGGGSPRTTELLSNINSITSLSFSLEYDTV